MHCNFNCITLCFDRTWRGIYTNWLVILASWYTNYTRKIYSPSLIFTHLISQLLFMTCSITYFCQKYDVSASLLGFGCHFKIYFRDAISLNKLLHYFLNLQFYSEGDTCLPLHLCSWSSTIFIFLKLVWPNQVFSSRSVSSLETN